MRRNLSGLVQSLIYSAAVVAPASAISVVADQTAYLAGEAPRYVVTGAAPGSHVRLTLVNNDATLSNRMSLRRYNAQIIDGTVDSDGIVAVTGNTWSNSAQGAWTVTAVSDDGTSADSHFAVVPELTVSRPKAVTQMMGIANWGGRVSNGSSLVKGAGYVRDAGSRSIKLAMTPNAVNPDPAKRDYPGTHFGQVSSLTDLAESSAFRQVFKMPFDTIAIDAHPFVNQDYLKHGVNKEAVKKEMHDLAVYLMTAYQGTGKTFILSNWEGDNDLRNNATDGVITGQELANMQDWLTARYEGIEEARRDLSGLQGVSVLSAVEFSSLDRPRLGQASMLRDVIPNVPSDLVSYSAYDSLYRTPTADLRRSILNDMAFIRSYPGVLDGLNGPRGVIVGEFGESTDPSINPFAAEVSNRVPIEAQAFADGGAEDAFYWQMVDGGDTDKGMGLRAADGTPGPVYQSVCSLLPGPAVASDTLPHGGAPRHLNGLSMISRQNAGSGGRSIDVISLNSPATYRSPLRTRIGSTVSPASRRLTPSEVLHSAVDGPAAPHEGLVIQ